jgi:hypothetical protein
MSYDAQAYVERLRRRRSGIPEPTTMRVRRRSVSERAAYQPTGPGPTLDDVFARHPGWRAALRRVQRERQRRQADQLLPARCKHGHDMGDDRSGWLIVKRRSRASNAAPRTTIERRCRFCKANWTREVR